jgi:hypothetical protein
MEHNLGSRLRNAVISGDLSVVETLLEKGADVNYNEPDTVSPLGGTPLHCAALKGSLIMVRLLIDNGADVTITDKRGMRPYHYAAYSYNKHLEIVHYLKCLEPKEFHDMDVKLAKLQNYNISRDLIAFFFFFILRIDLSCSNSYSSEVEFMPFTDTVETKFKGKKLLLLTSDIDGASCELVWDPKAERIGYVDIEHDYYYSVCSFAEFMEDPSGIVDKIVDGEYITDEHERYIPEKAMSKSGDIESVISQIAETKAALADKKTYDETLGNKISELQNELSLLMGAEYGTTALAEAYRDELLGRLDDTEKDIDNMIDVKLSEVSYWRYASGDYFHHLPYYNEVKDFKKGRILKNVVESDRFNKSGVYSFGFDAQDRLVITQYSSCAKHEDYRLYGVNTIIHTTNPDGSVDSCVAKWYPTREKKARLISIQGYKWLQDNNRLNVGVGANRMYQTWSTMHYIYDEPGKLVRVVSGGPHGGKLLYEFYDFIYDQGGGLEKIVTENCVIWKRK